MQKILYILLINCIVVFSQHHGPVFGDFLDRISNARDSEKQKIADDFVKTIKNFPLIEQDTICYFVYQDIPFASHVNIITDANAWLGEGFPMTNIPGTYFWYRKEFFESDAHFSYIFNVDGRLFLDKRNPFTYGGMNTKLNELRMPDYITPPELEFYPDIEHGDTSSIIFESTIIGNQRRVVIYTPYGYIQSQKFYPIVIFHDGDSYIRVAKALNVLDYLIHNKRIEPLIAVFIPPVERRKEYVTLNTEYGKAIFTELMPVLYAEYRISAKRENQAVLGISHGSDLSLWMGLQHPDVFGNIAAFSGFATWNVDGYEQNDFLDQKMYIDTGTYEELFNYSDELVSILNEKGYNYRFNKWHSGHAWTNWRDHLDNALEFFFPGEIAKNEKLNVETFAVLFNYPNPFNNQTRIRFSASENEKIRLEIFDLSGRSLQIRDFKNNKSGVFDIDINTAGWSSGIYFYRMSVANKTKTAKMTLIR